ncbi:hypothetical protein [Terriglobus sp. RCC_193]|uniref:hypothetical protein n=1 Tax=Terriglobus sp. RCC_193 TaxID=3239218 RepID=UPI003526338E
MAKEDILNPIRGFDKAVADSMTWDYKGSLKGSNTVVGIKAAGGRPMDIETTNGGTIFTMSYTGRSLACVRRVKRFCKQFRRGFFTVLDWEDIQPDGTPRQYVGRFVTEPEIQPDSFGKWSISGLQFEEVPTVAMLSYPANWADEAISLFVRDDYDDLQVVTEGSHWTEAEHVRAEDGVSYLTLVNDGTTANEWAQYEYKGYGFRIFAESGTDCGQFAVALDGMAVGTVDLYFADALPPSPVFEKADVPLDFHRVKIIVLATKNGAATAARVPFFKLEVMQ